MKNTVKTSRMRGPRPRATIIIAAASLACALSIASCPAANEAATITIYMGGSAGRAVYTPDDATLARLIFMVQLSGPSTVTVGPTSPGEKVIKVTVDPGRWSVTVTAYLDGKIYATGSAVSDVSAGLNNKITVSIKYAGEEEHTVTFDADGGVPVPQPQTVPSGGKATRPDNPAKDGFGFVNWCTDETLKDQYDFNTPVTGDITLYAKWSQTTHTVTFYSMGGSPVEPATVGHGGTVTRPDNPAKDGFGFVNWCTDETLKVQYDFDTPVTGDITLYARWIAVHTVTFNSMGGSPVDTATVVEGGTVTRPDNPTKNDFGFVDWYTDENGINKYDFNTPVTGDITLYAQWNKITHTITFNSMGGSPVDPATVGEGGTASRPGDPTKSGFVFIGWFIDENGNNQYDFTTPVTGNITLYARWNQTTHTVTFDSRGGSIVQPPNR